MTYYLFTTQDTNEIVLLKECSGAGTQAAMVRNQLAKKHGKPITSWCCMGGDNPKPVEGATSTAAETPSRPSWHVDVAHGFYRLRNGIIFETGRDDRVWSADAFVVSHPENYRDPEGEWSIGEHQCLAYGYDDPSDPMTWRGGTYGRDYDIVEKIDDPSQPL
jgi:hypothetical protein